MRHLVRRRGSLRALLVVETQDAAEIFAVTARLLPWGIRLDAREDLFVEDEAIEEFLPFFG